MKNQKKAPKYLLLAGLALVLLAGGGAFLAFAQKDVPPKDVLSRSARTKSDVLDLQASAERRLAEFDRQLAAGNTAQVENLLSFIQNDYRQILSRFPQLSLGQRQTLATTCAEQIARLEIAAPLLPESYQDELLHVQAACHAMKAASQ